MSFHFSHIVSSFKAAQRLSDRLAQREMNEDILQYADAFEAAPEGQETEGYFLALLIHRQKLIDRLEKKAAEIKLGQV